MEVQHERDQAGMTTVRAEVPAEVVNETYDKALRRLKRQVNVPGFRRGKVPPKMVESILGKENILDYAKELFEESVVPDALTQLPTLVALDTPELTIERFERGEPAQVTVRVLTAMVQLGETKGIAVEQMRSVVEDSVAEGELVRYHQANATYSEADHSDVRDGDFVLFALRIVRDGLLMEEYTQDDPLRIQIGNNHLDPNIDQHLIGVSVGQSTTFEVTYPEDYGNEELRGATAEFTVEVLAVQSLEPLEALIERLGASSKEQVIESLKARMGEEQGNMYRLMAREQAVQGAIDSARLDIPRAYLETQIMEEIEEFEEELAEREVDADADSDDLIAKESERIRERIERETKRDILLQALAQIEGIELEEQDLVRELSMLSMYNRVEPRLMLQRLQESGEIARVAHNARIRKAAEYLLEHAVVTEVDPPADLGHVHDHDHGHDHDHVHDHGHDHDHEHGNEHGDENGDAAQDEA